MPEVFESRSEKVWVWKAPMGGMEKALWAVVCTVEGLVSGQATLQKELIELQNSSLRSEDHFELLSNNLKSIVDLVELFTCGEHYLRVWEMGRPEVPKGLEYIPRKTRQRLGSFEQQGRDPIREPEKEPEVEPEVETEVVLVDVEMTLQ